MNRSAVVAVVTITVTAVVVAVLFLLLPQADTIHWGEVTSESLVVVAVFVIIQLVARVRAADTTIVIFLSGLSLFYAGVLIDLLDEILRSPMVLAVTEDVAASIGIVVICVGFAVFMRNQQELLREVEGARNRLATLSITDGLTRLFNSRYFYERMDVEIERARRYRRPLSLLLLDIDDFKRFNDQYGHLAGDRVLRRLGALILDTLRENDTAYRYGGEEFTILLPETDADQAAVVGERLRTAFAEEEFESETRKTISIGVSEYDGQEDAKSFVGRVDEAMYAAKRAGKNRVVTRPQARSDLTARG